MSDPQPEQGSGGLIHKTDLAIALIILAVCAWLYYLTTKFEKVSDLFAQDVPPEFFPRLLLWIIVFLTLVLPIEHRLHKLGRKGLDKGRQQPIKPMTFLTIALLTLILLLMPLLGTYLCLIVACVLMPMLWGERRLHLIIPYALIFSTLVMLLFAQVLQIYFLPGVFGLNFR